jgi:hypothetical protein
VDSVANEVVTIAARLGGSATKGLQDSNRLSVLVDVPSNREQEFRSQMASITEERPGSSGFAKATADRPTPATEATPATGEKKSFVVQIVEKQ